MQKYVVKRGDTLYGISNQFGVSVTELASLNQVNANTLQIGQVLMIPEKAGTNPNNMFIYTVSKGDTLYSVAKKYNTSVSAILDLNNLSSSNLSIGQQLRIPESYTPEEDIVLPQYQNYVVKKGDTLYSIARDNSISLDVLKQDNALVSDTVYPGQNLKIRTENNNVLECFGQDYIIPQISPNYFLYTVVAGDNLYSIAKRFSTTPSDIIQLNQLTSNNLEINQVLKIPSSSSSFSYTVLKGDSLWSIAQKFQTTVDSIKKINNLTSNNLSIGQILKLERGY